MSAPSSSQSAHPWDHPMVAHELVTQEWCNLHCLIEELSWVQSRLGTPLEEPKDYVLVRDLGHQIRNKLHLLQLWAELGVVSRDELLLAEAAI